MGDQLEAAPGAAHGGVAAAGEAVDPSTAALKLIHGLGDRSADRMAELTERKRAWKQERADVASRSRQRPASARRSWRRRRLSPMPSSWRCWQLAGPQPRRRPRRRRKQRRRHRSRSRSERFRLCSALFGSLTAVPDVGTLSSLDNDVCIVTLAK